MEVPTDPGVEVPTDPELVEVNVHCVSVSVWVVFYICLIFIYKGNLDNSVDDDHSCKLNIR